MRKMLPKLVLAAALATIATPGFAMRGEAPGHHGHRHPDGEEAPPTTGVHGGPMMAAGGNHYEVLFTGHEARIYLYDGDGKPLPRPEGVTPVLDLAGSEGEPLELKTTWIPPDPVAHRTQGFFAARHDFEGMNLEEMQVTVRIEQPGRDPVRLEAPFGISQPLDYVCPMGCVDPVPDPMPCPTCGMEMLPSKVNSSGHGGHHSGN